MTTPTESPEDIALTPLESIVLWALVSLMFTSAAVTCAAVIYAGWIL